MWMPAMPHSAARLGLLLSVTVVCLTASVWGSADELALQASDNNGGGHRQHNRHQRHQHEHRAHHGRHSALLDDNELAWVGGLLDLASDLQDGAMQYGLGVPTAAPGSSAFLADEPGAWGAKDSPKRHRRQQQRAALLQGGPAAAPDLGMSAQQQQQLQGKQALKPAPAGKAPAKGQQQPPAASDADTDVEVYEYEIEYIEDDNEEEAEDSKGREPPKNKTQMQPGTKAAPKHADRALPTKPGSSSPSAKTQQAGAKEQQQQQQQQKQQVLQERQKERQQLLQQQLALKQKQKQQLAKQSVLAKATNAPTNAPQAPPSEQLPKPKDVLVPPHLSGPAQVPALFAPALQKPVPSPHPTPAHPAPLHTPQAQLIPDPGPEPGYMVVVPSPPPSVLQQDKSAALGATGSPGYKAAAPSPSYGGFGGYGYGGSVIKGITGSKGAAGHSTDSSDKSFSSKPGAGDQTTSAGGKDGTATEQKKGTQSESDSFDSSWFYGDGLDSGTGATPTPPGQERKFGDYSYEAPTPAVSGWPTNPQVPAEGDLAVPTAGGCKPGSTPSDVVGDALVIEDGTPASSKAMKATADCLIEGFNTYQYGGDCELYCTEASDYGLVQMVRLSIKTGGSGQTVCGALRHSTKAKMVGICSIIPVSNCCEPANPAGTK